MIRALSVMIPAVLAVLPLFGPRFIPTHDGEYHLIRFWQFFQGLSHEGAFPRWANDLNGGFGIPLFTFQYPFPNVVGSLFHAFGLSYVDSVKWTLAAGYLTAIACCYVWLRKRYGYAAAFAGTVAGSFVPYWFVDLYVRGSVGEVWALAFVFAALASISRGRMILVSLSVTLLILSHNILAMLFTPVILLYAAAVHRSSLAYILLGIGGAAFFWLPALYEQRFITGLSPVNVFDHFPSLYQLLIPSWGTGFRGNVEGGNEMSYQIGVAPILAVCMSVLLLMRRAGSNKNDAVFVLLLFAAAVFGMLPWSGFLWSSLPLLVFVQYPWRLLSAVVIAMPAITAFAVSRSRAGWVLPVLAVATVLPYVRPVSYEPRTDAYYLAQESFTKGTSSLGNAFRISGFSPDTAATSSAVMDYGSAIVVSADYTDYTVKTSAATPSALTLPKAYYPGWQARVDGRQAGVTPDARGLVTVPLEPGDHTVRIAFAQTWWQILASVISILSLSAATVSFILRGRYYESRD